MATKTPIKLKINIVEDKRYSGAGIGKKYMVQKWIYERKTGRTVDYGTYGTGYSYKEALAVKARIKQDYLG